MQIKPQYIYYVLQRNNRSHSITNRKWIKYIYIIHTCINKGVYFINCLKLILFVNRCWLWFNKLTPVGFLMFLCFPNQQNYWYYITGTIYTPCILYWIILSLPTTGILPFSLFLSLYFSLAKFYNCQLISFWIWHVVWENTLSRHSLVYLSLRSSSFYHSFQNTVW